MNKKHFIRNNGLILLLAGIVIGLVLAFVFDWTHDSPATPESNAPTLSEAASSNAAQSDVTVSQQVFKFAMKLVLYYLMKY
jgi:hypothetical protein